MLFDLHPLITGLSPFHALVDPTAAEKYTVAGKGSAVRRLAGALVIGLVCAPQFGHAQSADTAPSDLLDALAGQRELYQQARQAQSNGNGAEYQALRTQLDDYPLLPYLDYHELSPKLAALAASGNGYHAVEACLNAHCDSWPAGRLARQW